MLKKIVPMTLLLSLSLYADVIRKSGSLIDISMITDMSIVTMDSDHQDRELFEIPGFTHAQSEAHEHDHTALNSLEGFNFNYAELSLSSTVDPYFDLFSVFHLTENSIEIEEAFFVTKRLPVGIKAGKFYSNLGRLNTQHHHYWSFTSQPLVYEALFGEHNLLEKGIAFHYTLPADSYYGFGIEFLRGENSYSFGSEEIHDPDKGIEVEPHKQPNLVVAYMKNSFEISDRLTLLDNISLALGKANINHLEEGNITSDAFSGDTQIINIGLALRYDFSSYSHLALEGEYMKRSMEGTIYNYVDTAGLSESTMTKDQAGFYLFALYRLNQNYSAGFRYDALHKNLLNDLPQTRDLKRYTAMIEYNPSEFSKIRLEYVADHAAYIESSPAKNNRLILQFNHVIGTHKAHTF